MKIRAEAVTKQYIRKGRGTNVFYAVKETDFSLESGKMTVLMGRSGSGKSTLLNMLAGLLAPTSGKVFYYDMDLYAMEDKLLSRLRNEKVGVIPQGQTAIHSLNVLENVLLPYTLYGSGKDYVNYAKELLEQVGIADLGHVMPSELSGGEMRRMAIARAMIRKPEMILADEPTGDLDDENTQEVLKLLRKAADDGAAVLLVTHENEAKNYADDSYEMSAGVLNQCHLDKS